MRRENRLRGVGPVVLLALTSAAVTVILLEGLSSLALFGWDVATAPGRKQLAETLHVRHDALLGWVNIPNKHVPNMYGDGVYLRVNAQGFRNNHDIPPKQPAEKLRVICSGDSFTLGYGVDNDHTWCATLESLDPRLETVNMGQGGYGIDQAFLWYQRDAAGIEHRIHLFAFTTYDFDRMQGASFLGTPKPTLAVRNGVLTVEHVPVPDRPWYGDLQGELLRRFLPAVRHLRLFKLAAEIRHSVASDGVALQSEADPATWSVVSVLFERLQALNRARGSTPVLVYLPVRRDRTASRADPWRKRIAEHAVHTGVAFVDLIEDFRSVPAADMAAMFIPEGSLDYDNAAGHYTVQGNRWVSERLYHRLASLPGLLGDVAGDHRGRAGG